MSFVVDLWAVDLSCTFTGSRMHIFHVFGQESWERAREPDGAPHAVLWGRKFQKGIYIPVPCAIAPE